MVLETIYVVRHGFRMSWSVDPHTVQYYSSMPTPTGLPTDPALSSYGERQADQLGAHMLTLDPPPDQIISSPYYRCLQTIKPGVLRLQQERGYDKGVYLESGFEEWFGETGDHREQPGPVDYNEMRDEHFPDLNLHWYPLKDGDTNSRGADGVIRPNKFGESIASLHNRVAYVLHKTIERADREGWKAIVICMHAAVMISIGRALTGKMPEDVTEEDFHCYTASMSRYQRRNPYKSTSHFPNVRLWDYKQQHIVPDVSWKTNGVMGGWDCIQDADCSYLEGGEERGWHFNGEESFIVPGEDPTPPKTPAEPAQEEDDLNLNRALCTVVALAEDEIGEKIMDDVRSGRSKL